MPHTSGRNETLAPVLAYIDAGSGSLIIQALIAAVVAVPYVLRAQIGRAVRRIRGRPAATADSEGISSNKKG